MGISTILILISILFAIGFGYCFGRLVSEEIIATLWALAVNQASVDDVIDLFRN
jgi:hypothetical protein